MKTLLTNLLVKTYLHYVSEERKEYEAELDHIGGGVFVNFRYENANVPAPPTVDQALLNLGDLDTLIARKTLHFVELTLIALLVIGVVSSLAYLSMG